MSSGTRGAGKAVKEFNDRLDQYETSSEGDKTLDFIRAFHNELPPGGKKNLREEVCGYDDDQLRRLVKHIRSAILIPLKSKGGNTPVTPTPRENLEDSLTDAGARDTESINRSPQSQLREQCLERDGYRCVASRLWSVAHPQFRPADAETGELEAARIIPYSLGVFDPNNSAARRERDQIWSALGRYFPVLHRDRFTPDQINSARNMLTLDAFNHKSFGRFDMILEATRTTHKYNIKTWPGASTSTLNIGNPERKAHLRVYGGRCRLPDLELLFVHAAVGRFLHATGEAERIDKILRDYGDSKGLAPSGGSNIEDLLSISGLTLRSTNIEGSPGPSKSLSTQHSTKKQGRQRAKTLLPPETQSSSKSTGKHRSSEEGRRRTQSFGSENEPWGHRRA